MSARIRGAICAAALVSTFIVAVHAADNAATTKAADDRKAAEKLYMDVYGVDHERAVKAAAADKLKFAKQLAEAVKTAGDTPALAGVLREKAAEFAAADPAGYPLAVEQLRASLADAPSKRTVLEHLADVLDKQVKAEKGAAKAKSAGELEAAYRDLAGEQMTEGDFEAAGKTIDRAKLLVRTQLKSSKELLAELDALAADSARRKIEAAKLAEAMKVLAAKPNDPAANAAVGLHRLIADGKPAEAAPLLAKAVEPAYRKLGEMLAKPPGEMELADALRAAAQASQSKETTHGLYVLAVRHYQAALDAAPIGPQATRIKLVLGQIADTTGIKPGPAGESRPVTKGDPGTTTTPAGASMGEWKEVKALVGSPDGLSTLAFTPDGKLLAGGDTRGNLTIWDTASGEAKTSIACGESLTSVVITPDGKGVAGDVGPEIKVYELAGGKLRKSYKCIGYMWSFRYTPDGRAIASGIGDGSLQLFDAASGRELANVKLHAANIRMLAISPDGRTLASACEDGTVKLWDMATRKERLAFPAHTGGVYCIVYSPDGKTIATGGVDKTVKVWTAAGKPVTTIPDFGSAVDNLAFSPDSKTLATAGPGNQVGLWNPATGENRQFLTAHQAPIHAVAFSRDGKTLATGSWDRTVRLWMVSTDK